jgi:hypothetical protein
VRDCSLKKEEKDMSKSQSEKKWMAHIKCFKCSNMGHYASMCSNKVDDKTSLPKKKTRRSERKCCGCNEKGHEIASCSYKKDGLCTSLNKRQIGNKQIKNHDVKKKKISCNDKQYICYTCRRKGHIGKNCLLGKISKPNSFIDHS